MDATWFRALLGKRVTITLVCGAYSGCLRHVDTATKAVVLDQGDIEDLENKRKLPGVKIFFGYEIKNLEILEALPTPSVIKLTNDNSDEKGKLEDAVAGKAFGDEHSQGTCNDMECKDLEYIVIDQFHQKFGPAIFHIKQQNVIGVAVKGINVCRFGKLCWMQISTSDRIYLFDIFLLGAGAFKNGLKMVLEDLDILKVTHDCRLLSDCLYHQYRVDLTNIFDTQVADILQFSTETGGLLPSCVCTLEECLIHYLDLSPTKVQLLQHSAAVLKASSLELPYELKELTIIQRLRKEEALKNYKTDENGLLVRPYPRFAHKSMNERKIINIDDIPELESTKTLREDVTEIQNEEIPLLEPGPSYGEDICPPLE
ncbi:piRNA biogenesis protein EXD1 isoform X6 [Narcine bancroftii]|uniref:piRNA biogenesis protein EXD1 isoform X6 n=1 Tax=Narcine bancroftii TaxID=1343680 RepID=UPI0038317B9E